MIMDKLLMKSEEIYDRIGSFVVELITEDKTLEKILNDIYLCECGGNGLIQLLDKNQNWYWMCRDCFVKKFPTGPIIPDYDDPVEQEWFEEDQVHYQCDVDY